MAAGLLPLALYAFGVRTRRKRAEAAAEEALRPRSYGQVGGAGPVVEYQEGMEGFVPQYTKIGNQIVSAPKPEKAAKLHPGLFAPPSEGDPTRPNKRDFRTMAQWNVAYGLETSPEYIANKDERSAALKGLFPIGTLNPTSGVPTFFSGLDFDEAPPKDEGKQVWMIMGGNFGEVTRKDGSKVPKVDDTKIYTLGDAQRRANEYGGQIISGKEFTDPKGNKTYQWNETSTNAAIKALNAVSEGYDYAYLDPITKEKEYFKVAGKTAPERMANLSGFVGSMIARGLDWNTFGTGDFLGQKEKLYAQMYAGIKADNMLMGPDGKPTSVLDNRRFSAIREGNYPEFFAVPGFTEYFTKTRSGEMPAVKANMASNSEKNGGVDVSFMEEQDDGLQVPVNVMLPKGNAEANFAKTNYDTLYKWSFATRDKHRSSPDLIGSLLGNILTFKDQPEGSSILEATDTQPYLGAMANFSQQMTPSIYNGKNTDFLTNAYLHYRPIERGIDYRSNTAALAEFGAYVGNAGGGSLNEREQQYNIQLGLVSVIAPNLASTDPATLYSDMAWESEFFGTKTYEENRAAERAQARGGLDAIRLINSAQEAFFVVEYNEKGEPVSVQPSEFGQGAKEILLTFDSFKVNAQALGKRFGLLKPDGTAKYPSVFNNFETSTNVVTQLMEGMDNNPTAVAGEVGGYLTSYSGVIDAGLSDAQLEIMAAQRGQTLEQFKKEEGKARAVLDTQIEDIVAGLNSGETELINAAKRKFLDYAIAYAVASAMQGGTGGRTISDQDVERVYQFIRTGGLGDPEKEFMIFQELKEVMLYKTQQGLALSSPNKQEVFNAMIHQDLVARKTDISGRVSGRVNALIKRLYDRQAPTPKSLGGQDAEASEAQNTLTFDKMNEDQQLYVITTVNNKQGFMYDEPIIIRDGENVNIKQSFAAMRKVMGDDVFAAAVNNAIQQSVRSTDTTIQNLFATAPETSE